MDCIADLVAAEDPRALAERMLDALIALSNGRRGALFSREHGTVKLFSSRGVDQAVLEFVQTSWNLREALFQEGRVLVAPSEAAGEIRPPEDVTSAAVVPVSDGQRLIGLLYVDSNDKRFTTEDELYALNQFARIGARALATPGSPKRSSLLDVETYLEKTSPDEIAKEQLLVLLDRHEWNISRVARLIGVTRQTIYTRLQRYGIERQRISKLSRARQTA
jgi:transcriptional regulator with GAF, ATPase, and Fis domain